MKNGYLKVSKRDWYHNGGFAGPRNFRRMRGGRWHYYMNYT